MFCFLRVAASSNRAVNRTAYTLRVPAAGYRGRYVRKKIKAKRFGHTEKGKSILFGTLFGE